MQVKKQQLELDMEQQTGSKSGKEYVNAVYWHSAHVQLSRLALASSAFNWSISVENSERDGHTRPPDLPPEKTICRSRSKS